MLRFSLARGRFRRSSLQKDRLGIFGVEGGSVHGGQTGLLLCHPAFGSSSTN